MYASLHCTVVPVVDVPTDDLQHSFEERRPSVLVVHDEEMVADCMAVLLTQAGFMTRTAYDGKSALELAFELRPELLVSDIGLRGINGVQLAISITNVIPGCKVLLFSSHETHDEMVTARAEGYDFPALAKPVHPSDMLKRVKECFATVEPVRWA